MRDREIENELRAKYYEVEKLQKELLELAKNTLPRQYVTWWRGGYEQYGIVESVNDFPWTSVIVMVKSMKTGKIIRLNLWDIIIHTPVNNRSE
jgi:hypothetical protein